MTRKKRAPRPSLWTEARLDQLVALWNQRLSAAKIAEALGPGFTRNAVVGKLFRLGLRRTEEQRQDAQAEGARYSRAIQRRREDGGPFRARPVLPVSPLPPPTPCDVIPHLAPLDQLRRSSCRWPYGDFGDVRFCGHPARPESSYCPAHHRIAYFGRLPPLTLEALQLREAQPQRRAG